MLSPFEFTELIVWHAKHGRSHLPWRNIDHLEDVTRGYRIWLSEIFLQQTQAERVIGFYERVLERFPNISSLAMADYETFFPYYQGLGYYHRAHNLLACAKIVTQKYHGVFPQDTEALQKLPGIGPYTAQAIRAFVYDIPTLSFDTNLEKIFSRYYFGSRFVRLSPLHKAEITSQFVQSGLSSRIINGALMDFATIVSKNSKLTVEHDKSPFQNCLFKNTKGEMEIVAKKPITYFPRKDAQIEVILHKNHSEYYSSSTTEYSPFILPPTQSDIRKYVQEYFRATHGLEISVRPIHSQEYRNDVPYISMYAQIQTGISNFKTYSSAAGASDIGTKSQRIL